VVNIHWSVLVCLCSGAFAFGAVAGAELLMRELKRRIK
jgi:hypothetical protein